MGMFLPLFPLKLVVFPTEKIKLHVFEARYKQLIGECRADGTLFGLPPYMEGGIAPYGTEMRLTHVLAEDAEGEMDIIAEGVRAFGLRSFVKQAPSKLYPGGEVSFIENDATVDPSVTHQLTQAFARFHDLLGTGYTRDRFDLQNVSFQIGQEVGFTLEQKIGMLSLACENDRQRMIVEHLERVLPLLDAAEETRKRVRGNGHVQSFPPIQL